MKAPHKVNKWVIKVIFQSETEFLVSIQFLDNIQDISHILMDNKEAAKFANDLTGDISMAYARFRQKNQNQNPRFQFPDEDQQIF